MPLLASAAAAQTSKSKSSIFYSKQNLNVASNQEIMYQKLKAASRNMCGSSNLHLTGSIERSIGNNDCYEGTLTAAVNRLDNPQVTAIHYSSSD